MAEMDQYLVHFRNSYVDDLGYAARCLPAHKVEGWNRDYAFFGHPRYPGKVTTLIPRDLVDHIELSGDAQSGAFFEAVEKYRTRTGVKNLRAVVGTDTVWVEYDNPDGKTIQSTAVYRSGWDWEEAAEVAARLVTVDLGLSVKHPDNPDAPNAVPVDVVLGRSEN